MYQNDPNSGLERAVGKLEGVVEKLTEMVDKIWQIMDNKIDDKQGRAIAQEAIIKHERNKHDKDGRQKTLLLTSRQKQILYTIVLGISTAAVGFLTAKYGL